MPYRSWFSSWVRSVFKAFAGGMVRWGGMLIRFAVSLVRRTEFDSGVFGRKTTSFRLCRRERKECGERRFFGGYGLKAASRRIEYRVFRRLEPYGK